MTYLHATTRNRSVKKNVPSRRGVGEWYRVESTTRQYDTNYETRNKLEQRPRNLTQA